VKNMRSALEAAGLQRRVDGISFRAKQTVISPIKEMALLADSVPNAVSLGWGLPSFETPEHIREAVRCSLLEDTQIGKYPHPKGLPELRVAISEKLKAQWNIVADPHEELLVTVGAQQAVATALQAIVDPGDEVILFSPCFSSHIDQVLLTGGVPKYVHLIEEEGWRLRPDDVEKAINKKTKVIVVNSPNNPTGTVFHETDLRAIAELAVAHNLFVLTDETYNFLTYEGPLPFSMFAIERLRRNLISCYSFSKEYAMTGWRVGYLRAEGGLIQEILKIHDATVVTAPRISQLAALAAIRGPQECVAGFRSELSLRRELMCNRLDRLEQMFSYQKPNGAYYILPRINVSGVNSFDFALRLLYEAKVVTTPGDAFGPAGNCHLRLCFSVTGESITEAFDRLERFAQANALM
jgi:aminotransferase